MMRGPQLPVLVKHAVHAQLNEGKPRLTFGKAVLMATECVEEYSKLSKEKLHGDSKLQLAKATVPRVVQSAVEQGFVTAEEATGLQMTATLGVDVIGGVIEALIEVSKHPTVVQAVDRAKKKCAEGQGCLPCKRR